MASPFAIFRRNQKILLATVGIGAMIAFVFLDPVMRYTSGSRGPENPVVVETKYGALKESDLQNMRYSRELVDQFLQRVAAETITSQVKSGALDARMADQALERWYSYWQRNLMYQGRSTMAPEESAVETLVLSKRAQQMGIVISDRVINDFLKQLSADSLTSSSIEQIIGTLQGPQRKVSASRLFDAIRTEMLAARFADLFSQSLRDIPPAQKFEYYCRLNRRAKVELAPLAVADFIGQVPDPSAAELQTFFEKYRDRYADPASPDPGFKEPKRATFQYFKADYARFKEQAAPQVTDAEIAEYYEKNKEQFRALELPDKKDEADADKADSDKKDEAEKPDEQPAGGAESKPDAPPADENKPTETDAPAKAENDKPAEDKTSNRAVDSRFRLVSTAADDEQPAAGPKLEGPAEDAAKPAASEGEEKPKVEASDPAEKPTDESKADAEPEAEQAAEEKKPEPPKYEPLEKVRDQIRESLAGQKASKQIGEIFEALSADMKRYADDMDEYNARKAGDSRVTPPKPVPFAELAKAKGIEAKELANVTASEAADEDIGKTRQIVQDRRSQFGFRADPFAQYAFSESLPLFKPVTTEDNDGNGFLFWKTDEKAAFVPALDQVRDKVVRAWKLIKARDLARKRAEEYAGQARDMRKPLKEAFANQPSVAVSETDWFSWMTMGSVPFDPSGGQPRLSKVEGVEYVGPEFMRVVFGLAAGDVAVATNEPQDTVYVVRLADFEKPLDELRQDFAGERQPMYLMAAGPDQRQMFMTWLDNVEKDAGVHWVRPADVARRNRPLDEPAMPDAEF